MSKGILVYIEQRDKTIQNVSLELLGKARELAASGGEPVIAALLGHDVRAHAETLIARGADEVVIVDDAILAEYMTEPYAKGVTAIIEQTKPSAVLFGATSIGRDLAPRISARIHTGLTADCTSLNIEAESGNLLMTRPAFGGNIMATIVCAEHRPQMATVRPGVMKALPADTSRTGTVQVMPITFEESDRNVKILEVVKEAKKACDISAAKCLVSGGRGIGGAQGFPMLAELADVLGGEVSSSRACVDACWIAKERQVGQTGKTVRPELYVACGISGAIQHLAGMEESEFIVAINKNNTAPIFEAADLGIVGDVKQIVPKLTEAIKAYKAAEI